MKSHFQFSNKQRNGIFVLITLIISLQCVYMFVDFSETKPHGNSSEIQVFRNELDSLRKIALQENVPKIYPFNPNYITDYKGYTLGMTAKEIDRLHAYRAKNKWVNSKTEFQQVTHISDSLLAQIAPYFKFPDWVTNPKPKSNSFSNIYSNSNTVKTYAQKTDLNLASVEQLKKVYGVGEKLSERIINERNKYKGGFASDIELTEVWGLSQDVITRITNQFTVKTPRKIKTLNLNTASQDALVTIKYIDYEIANHIIEERTLKDGFKTLEDLTKVEDFPINKFEIIKLYLHL